MTFNRRREHGARARATRSSRRFQHLTKARPGAGGRVVAKRVLIFPRGKTASGCAGIIPGKTNDPDADLTRSCPELFEQPGLESFRFLRLARAIAVVDFRTATSRSSRIMKLL